MMLAQPGSRLLASAELLSKSAKIGVGLAEIEILAQVVAALVITVAGCFSKEVEDTEEEEKEGKAFTFLRHRPILGAMRRRKSRQIRSNTEAIWKGLGGDEDKAGPIGFAVEQESQSVDRGWFRELWQESHKAQEIGFKIPERVTV